MKNIVLASIALLMISCAPKESEDNSEKIREYQALVKEYTEMIEILEKETASASGTDADEQRATAVEIKQVMPEQFSGYFEAKGAVEAIEDAYISPEISGQIKNVYVERGQRVKKGDLLILLKTEVTQNTISEVKTSLELADVLFKKQAQLWEKQVGSEMQYLEARNGKESLEARLATLESQLEMAYVRAPFDGIVDDIMVKTGELASPGIRLLRLVNLDRMRITAQVSESFLQNVKVGEMVELKFASLPGVAAKEPIHRIGTVIDPVTRTFALEILMKNRNEMLKPNMLSSVLIQDYSDPGALLVPSIILKQDFKGTFLFRVKEDGTHYTAEKVYVKTGKTVQEITKIQGGLQAGDKVIVKGYNLVADGEKVNVLNK